MGKVFLKGSSHIDEKDPTQRDVIDWIYCSFQWSLLDVSTYFSALIHEDCRDYSK